MKSKNHKEKIKMTDSFFDVLSMLSEGNPGALTVLMKCTTISPKIDPECMLGAFAPLLSLDTHGIYGSNIWVLYKNCCQYNINGFLAVMRSIQMGLLAESDVWRKIDSCEEIDVNKVIDDLVKELPSFNVNNNPE